MHISWSGSCAVGVRIGRQFRSAPVLSVGVGVRLGIGVGVGVLGMGVGVGVGV